MPRRLAADSETLTERYGRFSAQPFERGFGTTVEIHFAAHCFPRLKAQL